MKGQINKIKKRVLDIYWFSQCSKNLWTFVKNNIVIFLCLLYLYLFLVSLFQHQSIKVNGSTYSNVDYFLYSFALPFIFCLFLCLFVFLFCNKKDIKYYLSIFYSGAFIITSVTSFALIYMTFSHLKNNIFFASFLSIFYVFCTPYFLNICAFIGLIYSILKKIPFKPLKLPLINSRFLISLCLILLFCSIRLITLTTALYTFIKPLILCLIFVIFCLLHLFFTDKKTYRQSPLGILIFITLFIVFFPAILFYFFQNGCLLKFIFF